jgi:leucyl aminopeptidase (aminopeptidase T)
MELKKSIVKFLHENACVTEGERIMVLYNKEYDLLATNIKEFSEEAGYPCRIIELGSLNLKDEKKYEKIFDACDVIFTNTSISLFHNPVINKYARSGKKVVSLTGADVGTFTGAAAEADFRRIAPDALKLAERMTTARHMKINSGKGTDIEGDITSRKANAETGINLYKNPSVFPDIEVNTSVIEAACNGKIVVDLCITKIGKLDSPLYLDIAGGKLISIKGERATEVLEWIQSFNDPNMFQVAEFGFGLNPAAQIMGNIIEDEGKLGTAHIGFGNNLFMGGQNEAKAHFDVVFDDARIFLDGELLIY